MSLGDYSASYYLLCIVAFLSMLSVMIINPLLSLFAKEIGASGVWIGYAVSGYWISRVILEIPSGYISSRFGYYKPMAFGLSVTVLGNILLVLVNNPVHLVIIRALKGIGAPFFFAISMTFIVNLVESEQRGNAMGIFQGIEFIGQIIGATFSGRLVQNLGWQGGFITALVLSILALALFVLPPYIRKETVKDPSIEPLKVVDVMSVLHNKTLLIISSVTLTEFVMTSGLFGTVLNIYANENLGFALSEVGYMMGARSLGFVLAMFTMGRFADNIGRKPVLLFGLLGTSSLVILMSNISSLYSMSILILLIGFTSGAIWIVGPVISAEAVPREKRGAAIGAYRTFFDGGSFIGPIIMTTIMIRYGIRYCFYVAGFLMLLTMPFVLQIQEVGKSKSEVITH